MSLPEDVTVLLLDNFSKGYDQKLRKSISPPAAVDELSSVRVRVVWACDGRATGVRRACDGRDEVTSRANARFVAIFHRRARRRGCHPRPPPRASRHGPATVTAWGYHVRDAEHRSPDRHSRYPFQAALAVGGAPPITE